MSSKIPAEIIKDLKKNYMYSIIIQMKNSVDNLSCSLDTAKDKINRLEDRSEIIIWNVAQRDNMVENIDETSIYCMISFL